MNMKWMSLWSSAKETLIAFSILSSMREYMKELLSVFMLQMTIDGKKTSSSGTVADSKL